MTQKPKISFGASPTDSSQANLFALDSILPYPPPTFPLFKDLVWQAERGKGPTNQRQGLFEALVGRVEPIYQDSLAHPEKFSEEALILLAEVISGSKSLVALSASDRRVLDLATIDFASATPTKKRPVPRAPTPRPVDRESPSEPAGPVVGIDVPEGGEKAYWWLT
jgi:hypothetical protein